MDYNEYTAYSSTIRDMYAGIIILIAVNNWLGLMDGYIGKEFCKAPCDETIWSCCGAEFDPRCGKILALNRDLRGLKTASKPFHKYFG